MTMSMDIRYLFYIQILLNETRNILVSGNILTHYMPVLPSYRNQSIDLLWKSTDWFLYEGNTGI